MFLTPSIINSFKSLKNFMRLKYIRIWFVFIWGFWGFFIFLNFINYSEDNPFKMKSVFISTAVRITLPQGWAFFTKNAREDVFDLYRLNKSNQLIKIREARQASTLNMFGLKRTARAMGLEFSRIVQKVPAKDSVFGIDYPDVPSVEKAIKEGSIKAIEISTSEKRPLLLGYIVIIKRKVIPWAWSSNYSEINYPINILFVNVKRN